MDVAPMNVHGWKFQFVDQGLVITSEQDSDVSINLSAKAAYSLLDYLYQYRNPLHEAAVAEMEQDARTKTPSDMQEVWPGRESEEVL